MKNKNQAIPKNWYREGICIWSVLLLVGYMHNVNADGYVPNDPKFNSQWYIRYIKADRAWSLRRTQGNALAIDLLDSGVDCSHEDLRNKCSGGVTVDQTGHGTLIAGIIAANSDNGIGIAGLGGSVVVTPSSYVSTSDELANAINKSTHRIIYTSLTVVGTPELKLAVKNAIAQNKFIICAAGNLNLVNGVCQLPPYNVQALYPAAYNVDPEFSESERKHILVVGATNALDNLAIFGNRCSNHANWIDLYAPGSDIVSTIPFNLDNQPPQDGYLSFNGTSPASAIVVGVVAMLIPTLPENWSAEMVHDVLVNSGDPLPQTATSEYSSMSGKRRVNALNALLSVRRPNPPYLLTPY